MDAMLDAHSAGQIYINILGTARHAGTAALAIELTPSRSQIHTWSTWSSRSAPRAVFRYTTVADISGRCAYVSATVLNAACSVGAMPGKPSTSRFFEPM